MKKSTRAIFRLPVLLVLPMVIVAGCRTKEFSSTPFYSGDEVKFTGNVEDRVNLWPLAYWREPVGSVAWPLVSFGNDHFALQPVYSQYKQTGKDGAFDEFNFLWPLCQADAKNDDYRVFPFFWGWNAKGHGYQTLFPVYWNGPGYNSLFPLWVYRNSHRRRLLSALFGMAGTSSDKDGFEANWCFPLWYWNSRRTFVTMTYGRWENGWVVPPLFSWGESETNGDYSVRCLLGLGGAKKTGGDVEHWAFPLYSRELLTCYDSSRICNTRLLLNLTGWENKNGELHSLHAFPLCSWDRGRSFLSPLLYWDNGGSLLTPLGGRTVYDSGASTNTYVTPLVGLRGGKTTGSWLFPLYDVKKDTSFEHYAAMVDAPRLPDEIIIRRQLVTNRVWNAETKERDIDKTEWRHRANPLYSRDEKKFLLFSDAADHIDGHIGLGYGSETNFYSVVRSRKLGNRLVFNRESRRTARFDAATRGKIADEETAETSFLLFLYNHERKTDLMAKSEHGLHTVLWRLWHWEEENGNVSLDVFPGFTYDSKTNGYSKTSFLWRLFRYESDPEKGTSADFLFMPVKRP